MRLKIQTSPPLPPLKAWYSTGSLELTSSSIADLKKHLCTHVEALRNALEGARSRISLTLDDFELLDESDLDILREGDLICINGTVEEAVEKPQSNLGKRKRAISDISKPKPSVTKANALPTVPTPSVPAKASVERIGDPAKRMLGAALGVKHPGLSKSHSPRMELAASSNDSSDGTSGETDTDTSTDSDSESEGDSDTSTSSSSSDDDGPPLVKTAKHPPTFKPPQTAVSQTHVPPGQGLPRTQSRNKRRRVKNQATRIANAPPPPPSGTSAVNSIPVSKLPVTSSSSSQLAVPNHRGSVTEALNGAFSSNALAGTLEPGDIVLSPSGTPTQASNGSTSIDIGHVMMSSLRNKNKKKGFKNSLNRPIPQKIVFGDGVGETQEKDDVEMAVIENILQTPRSARPRVVPPSEKQERGELPPNMFVTSVDVESDRWSKNNERRHDETQEDLQVLPYDDPEPPTSQTVPSPGFDWNLAESKFPTGTIIESFDQLRVGMYVGWMDLAINPETFTPEYLLAVSRVTSTTPTILTKPLLRPGAADISFSKTAKFATGLDDGGAAVEGAEDLEGDEVAVTWNEITRAQWKVLDIS